MKSNALAVLILVAAVVAGCQTAGDQLIELPPSETDVDSAGTEETADASGDEDMTFCSPQRRPSLDTLGEVPALHPSVDDYTAGVVRLTSADDPCDIEDVLVRVAETQEERAHGLMEVPDLPIGVGMWFTGYTEDRTGGFYMKDTLVPLQIAYVAADGTIVDVLEMTPCEADPCPTYPPDEPYRTTLEVPSGWLDEIGHGEGDRAELVRRGSGS